LSTCEKEAAAHRKLLAELTRDYPHPLLRKELGKVQALLRRYRNGAIVRYRAATVRSGRLRPSVPHRPCRYRAATVRSDACDRPVPHRRLPSSDRKGVDACGRPSHRPLPSRDRKKWTLPRSLIVGRAATVNGRGSEAQGQERLALFPQSASQPLQYRFMIRRYFLSCPPPAALVPGVAAPPVSHRPHSREYLPVPNRRRTHRFRVKTGRDAGRHWRRDRRRQGHSASRRTVSMPAARFSFAQNRAVRESASHRASVRRHRLGR
jgi:hypothetical protein